MVEKCCSLYSECLQKMWSAAHSSHSNRPSRLADPSLEGSQRQTTPFYTHEEKQNAVYMSVDACFTPSLYRSCRWNHPPGTPGGKATTVKRNMRFTRLQLYAGTKVVRGPRERMVRIPVSCSGPRYFPTYIGWRQTSLLSESNRNSIYTRRRLEWEKQTLSLPL